ncbi:MAG TPA: PilC/PilY family type IV pilus protein [Casimicrobiaceae bacterium]|nr:PilC/PilY family type IV pilus protein [Casimicrobiaceae bacterium]
MARNLPPKLRRCLAGVLAALIGLGPLATPAYAQLVPLADQPLNVKNSAHPNIILTVDDSTSMLFDFLPDYVAGTYCRGGTGAMTAACGSVGASSDFTLVGGGKYSSPGYVFEQYNYPYDQYATGYDPAGPGAGCYPPPTPLPTPAPPPTCSAAVNPGPLPGIASYPAGPQPTWPNSLQPYEYWLFWPAPPHSAGLNALYYDPRLTYDPPVDATGASYPTMDAGTTSNWSAVPADTWAGTVVYVDLVNKNGATPVYDGLWCNSDWSLGAGTDPSTCRYNGEGGPSFATVSTADGQDYTYPWAPPGFTVSASAGSTTAQTYAAQKVTLTSSANPTDPNYVKYGALFGKAVSASWANAKDPKYFYENENVLWCDPTSPSWPQTGPVTTQTCTNYQLQHCLGSPVAGKCVRNPGACLNAPTCNGAIAGTCGGAQPQLCNLTPGVCNKPGGVCSTGSCGSKSDQTCNGARTQTCPTSPQTCSGPFAQTCNVPGTQTCQPPVCSVTYDPPNCNLLPPDPENPCNAVTTCAPPVCTPDPGRCSITGATCTPANAATACPAQPGQCSVSGASCMSAGACPAIGTCSITGAACTSDGQCGTLPGTCSRTGQSCNDATTCPQAGTCQVGGAVCTSDANCPGTCANPAGLACFSAAVCNGTCTDGSTTCTSSGQCPATAGTCQVGGGACTANAQCPGQPATCSNAGSKNGNLCGSNADCLTPGTCSNNGANSCTVSTDCGQGLCTDGVTACSSSGQCPQTGGTCNTNAQACTSDGQCPSVAGTCSITGAACPTAGIDPVHCPFIGVCSVTGAACTPATAGTDCPSLTGPLPPSAAVCSTGGVGGVAAATLRNDAENAGVVCRRNNKSSGTYTSGALDYPSGKYLTPIIGGTGADACTVTDHYVAVPRHYWKSEVEWCDKKIAVAGDKWLGFGTDAGGTCQASKDATHVYPRFFQFGTTSFVDNYNTPAFQRVDLDIAQRATATFTHTWIDASAQTQTITRNFDEEMTNYANWFAYYRTRILAVKTVTSLSFTALDDQYRVGFATMSNGLTTNASQFDPATFVDIQDFTPAQKTAWFKQLFAIAIPLQLETPTLDSMVRVGQYFLNGGSSDFTGASDPITLSCQKNWHMLFTDGFTNQAKLPTTLVADQDNIVPTLPETLDPVATGIVPGSPWPPPFREDPTAGASNAASDYAMNYWVTDLRPTGAVSTDNVPATSKDPATWQHLNFAAMSLGTQGKLPTSNQSLTENMLASGALQWPQPYPTVYRPDNSGVDDLWHAATNGRGRFINAGNAAELKLGMGQILQDITNQAGSRAGVGLASSSISLLNHAVYRVTFQPGWAGTLTKIDINVVTGAEVGNLWEAATQLHTALTPTAVDPTCSISGSCPWFTNRRIFTTDDTGTSVPFLWNNLSSPQQDSLAPGQPAVGQAVLEYLRGNAANEGVSLDQFRVRATASFGENFLGDIVDSQALYIGPPNSPYLDGNDAGYSAFASAQASRPARVYVGANDGMLHAFDDATGDEAWAFVPHDLYRPDSTGLGALAYQDGALPPFRHHFYVDSTPRVVDVNLGGDWHTILVGGLGKGGRSYYALDVTNPGAVTDETTAASQYLWTFTDDNMGCSYGRPMLAKTRAFGGKWLMVVAAGYNNDGTDPSVCNPGTGDGKERIFFVDAATGKKLKEMTTGAGGATNALAQIAGYTQDFRNQLIDQIYGGDLAGNFWRFDVSDPDPNNWTVALMAQLTDAGGVAQPVTTPPQIEVDLSNSVDRWVFIGTGRLLDDSDLSDPTIANQQQTFYAMRDGTTTTPNPITTPLQRSDLVPLSSVSNGELLGLTSKPAKGWYDDLPAGQRIITPVQAAVSVVAYAGTSPQDNPCLTGEPATLYVRGFSTGQSLLDDAGGNPILSLPAPQGAVGLDITIFSDSSGSQSAAGIDIRVAVTAGTTGDVVFQHINPPAFLAAHRMSWRLLGQ